METGDHPWDQRSWEQKVGGGRWPGMVLFHETFEGLVSKALFQKSSLGSDLGREDWQPFSLAGQRGCEEKTSECREAAPTGWGLPAPVMCPLEASWGDGGDLGLTPGVPLGRSMGSPHLGCRVEGRGRGEDTLSPSHITSVLSESQGPFK